MKLEVNSRMKISVRTLVEFVLRCGDIDNRNMGSAEKDAMQAGARIHRKIQKKMGASYRAEVSLKHLVLDDEFELLVEGRADGVIEEPERVIIDEIKGIYRDVNTLDAPIEVHLAQALCYAYFFCDEHQIPSAEIWVTYCNLETEEIHRFKEERTYEELKHWFDCLIHEYMKWARYLYHHGVRRDSSIKELEFPYPYREGQRELAVGVYRTISRKKKLFIQAPTGIGKTLSTLFPAIKAIGEGYGEKLFYLTAKTITRTVAQEEIGVLVNQGLYFKSVTITSKEKLCFQEKPECNPEACQYARGHYDRVNEGVFDIIHHQFGITRELVLEYAQKHQICPFEFCLDITNWVDGIICDYNYVFDPNVKLRRYFSEGIEGSYLFLVDEAHNLVPRSREMYSALIRKEDFLFIKKLVEKKSGPLTRALNRSNQLLLEMKRQCETVCVLEQINALAVQITSVFGELERFLEEYREFEDRELVLDFYFSLRDFLWCHDRLDGGYQIYTELLRDGSFVVKLLCVNPALNLKECLDKGNSTIFFSATLLPIQYYKELLGWDQEDYAVYVPSPFPRENRLLLIAGDVTSKYTRRNKQEYEKILFYLCEMAGAKAGNYMAFFPSYQYMDAVYAVYQENKEAQKVFTCMVQANSMSEADRESFLQEFNGEREDTLVAFCVMGGMFSEGVDLTEDRLIGAAVIGTGLPMVCTEQEILKGYFDQKGERGFDFAYQYPGMNKVMQSAGRVIRTAFDQGVILLLDDRFLRREYQGMFPKEWDDYKKVTTGTVGSVIQDFWETKKKN